MNRLLKIGNSIMLFWRKRLFSLVCIAFFAGTAIYINFIQKPEFQNERQVLINSDIRKYPIGEITSDVLFRQTIKSNDAIDGIGINFATYARKNIGTINVFIKDDSVNSVLFSVVVKTEDLQDNSFKDFYFPSPITIPADHQVGLYIQGGKDCRPGNAVTCWGFQSGTESMLQKNGHYQKGEMQIRMHYLKKRNLCSFYMFWLMLSFQLLILKDEFLLNFGKYPEKIFLIIGISTVLAAFFFAPPIPFFDAPAHLKRIYQISKRHFLYTPEEAPAISAHERKWSNTLAYQDYLNFNCRIPFSQRNTALDSVPFHCGDVKQKHYIMNYSPVAYFHSAITAYFARKMNVTLAQGVFAISVVCALLYLTVMYMVIKNISYYKWQMLLLALTPQVFWLGISFSTDSVLNLLAFTFFAFFINLKTKDARYSTVELLSMAIISVLLCQCKFVYFPLLFLLFLLPRKNFPTARFYWIFITLQIFVSAFLGWGWNKISMVPDIFWNIDGRSTTEKMQFILHHPFEYTISCFREMLSLNRWHEWCWSYQLGCPFGVLCAIPEYYIYLTIMFFSTFLLMRNMKVHFVARLISLLIFFASLFLIFTALFCTFSDKFGGIQGRYLTPLLPLLCIIFSQNKWGLPEKLLPYYKGLLVIAILFTQIRLIDGLYWTFWY